ncbi:MAG: hypothetical protein ACI81T_000078 [Bacteroidia bacterium]|jgi:hypothetical protein
MNSFTLLNLVLNPEKAKNSDLEQLEELVEEHPYFQAGRLLIAKITKKSEHIKTAAAYTSERTVLMDVINSKFNKDVNLPNIDNLEIGSDDLALFEKLGKEEENSIPKITENTSFDASFPDISFDVEEEKSEIESVVEEHAKELVSETPPALPDLELPELDNEIEEQSIEELTDGLPPLDLPNFEEAEDVTNFTEKSIDDILKEMNITSNSDGSENDGVIDSDDIAEFKRLRAETEKSRLTAMEAMEAEERIEEEEKIALQAETEVLQEEVEEETPKNNLLDVEKYELPDYDLPKDVAETAQSTNYETSELKEEVAEAKSELFDNEDAFFGESEKETEVAKEIELVVEETEELIEANDDGTDFFEPKKSIFDVDDSLFSLDALLEQSFSQVDPVRELEKQPVLQTEDLNKKSIQDEQVDLIDNFIVKAPSLRISKDKIGEKLQENDLSEEQIRSQATPISENLATIMIKQQKFQKAIEIYEQLILKFPHKKVYFANLIEKLKNK